MQITIVDQTDEKLALFLPALHALQELNIPLGFQTQQSDVLEQFRKLSRLVANAPVDDENVIRILLIDDALKLKIEPDAKTLIYPIWPEKKRIDRNAVSKISDFFVPFGAQILLGHRLGDTVSLIDYVRRRQVASRLQGKRILITAGPTAEDLDPVRYLTNRSSGRMGVSLARAAYIMGANVQLVFGPGQAVVPPYLSVIRVRSAQQMAQAVFERFNTCDVYIGAAAVADFTPEETAADKIKKKEGRLNLPLKRTVDILQTLGKKRSGQILVGFSVETEQVIENSLQKLRRKNLDLIVVNNPKEKGAAFGVETNKVTVIEKNGQVHNWPLMNKLELSFKILELLAKVLTK